MEKLTVLHVVSQDITWELNIVVIIFSTTFVLEMLRL